MAVRRDTPIVAYRVGSLAALAGRLDDLSLPAVDRIRILREIEAIAAASITYAIGNARAESATWRDIAGALGTSRQAAWERYAASRRATRGSP